MSVQPANPHPQGKKMVTLQVTEEELFVIKCGVESEADTEDGEFAYIREVAGSMVLPPGVVTYQNMQAP